MIGRFVRVVEVCNSIASRLVTVGREFRCHTGDNKNYNKKTPKTKRMGSLGGGTMGAMLITRTGLSFPMPSGGLCLRPAYKVSRHLTRLF